MKWRRVLRVAAYVLYGFILAGVLVVWRFPSERLEQKLETLASERLGLRVEMADLSLSFPPGLKVTRCTVRGLEADSEPIFDAAPGYLGVRMLPFLGGRLGMTLRARAYDGSLSGGILLTPLSDKRRCRIEVGLQAIRLEKHPAASRLLGRQLTGKISGELRLDGSLGDLARSAGAGKLQLRDGSCTVHSPYLKVNTLENLEVDAVLKLASSKLEISSCEFKGDGVQGLLNGTVELRPRFPESTLDLSGQGLVDTALVRLDPVSGRAALAFLEQRKPIPFRLQGTLAAPRLRLF